ncbi:MAG: heavy-metal-associated domain-containing protein [Proteobacteria bacterium]|nr:heavy-metal-associated domain-containing protein [Pseudomonadota bacterium]
MLAFQVNDMTCGHCASTITRAVKNADKDAKVTIDLATHRVTVEPTEIDGQQIRNAIAEAGYTPVPVEASASATAGAAGTHRCCGSCN